MRPEGAERKPAYFEGTGTDPALARLYYRRLGEVDRILDLGCGQGGMGRHRPDRGVTVVGLDLDEHALRHAAESEQVVLGDLERHVLPFADDAFDGVVAKDILEHLDRPARLLAEVRRVLKPGGRVVASVPMAKPRAVWADYTHVRGFTADAVTTMFRDSGFDIESVTPMGGVPGAGKLGLVPILPSLLRLPVLRRWAVSHEIVALLSIS